MGSAGGFFSSGDLSFVFKSFSKYFSGVLDDLRRRQLERLLDLSLRLCLSLEPDLDLRLLRLEPFPDPSFSYYLLCSTSSW